MDLWPKQEVKSVDENLTLRGAGTVVLVSAWRYDVETKRAPPHSSNTSTRHDVFMQSRQRLVTVLGAVLVSRGPHTQNLKNADSTWVPPPQKTPIWVVLIQWRLAVLPYYFNGHKQFLFPRVITSAWLTSLVIILFW